MKRIYRKTKKTIYQRMTGLSIYDIAQKLNISLSAVSQERKRHGWDGIKHRLAMCDSH